MSEINSTLNDVFKNTPLGDVKSSIGSTLYGFNHRSTPLPVPINRDNHGYVFFTRPQLNLSTQNLRALRRMVPLLDKNENSLPRVIRRYLDPRLTDKEFPCGVVNNKQAFIPLLTNHILSCTGWPDPILDLYTSRPGVQKEIYALVDSVADNYGSYDLNATFRNMPGDPITAMFDYWMWYSSKVFTGEMMPYPDFIALNEIDYQTRVYRLVMDKNKQYVQKYCCTGASIVISNPMGNAFNYESDRPLNQLNDQIQMRFQSTGFCYNDPIVLREFNETVSIFNNDMANLLDDVQPQDHVKLDAAELALFNSEAYPFINQDTHELQWYIERARYDARMAGYQRVMESNGVSQ